MWQQVFRYEFIVQALVDQHAVRERRAGHTPRCWWCVPHLLVSVVGMPPQNAYRIQVGSAAISRITMAVRQGRSLATLPFHDGVLPGACS